MCAWVVHRIEIRRGRDHEGLAPIGEARYSVARVVGIGHADGISGISGHAGFFVNAVKLSQVRDATIQPR